MNTPSLASLRTRALFTITALASLTACGAHGLRASADGACPPGETCSSLAPNGAAFSTPLLTGTPLDSIVTATRPLTPVAVGGRATIHVSVIGRTGSAAPNPSLVQARAQNPAVLSATGGIPETVVTGLSAGSTMLRIEERATGALLDMIEMKARPVALFEVRPPNFFLQESGGGGYAPRAWATNAPLRWKLFAQPDAAPEPLALAAQLRDAAGVVLIDEDMILTFDGDAASASVRRWDAFSALPLHAGSLRVRANAAGASYEAVVEVTSRVDSIVAAEHEPGELDASGTLTNPVEVGDTPYVCFEPREGVAALYGVPLTVRASAGLTLENSGASLTTRSPCVVVEANAVGEQSVTASFGALTATVRMTVTPATRMRAASAPWAEQALHEEGEAPAGSSLGVRARGE